tara:strand:+ start:531 stop:710 length:180 start_codon:yes stop_codon:yes gene_type:complete
MRTGTGPFVGLLVVFDSISLVFDIPGPGLAFEDLGLGLKRGSGRHLHCMRGSSSVYVEL